MRLTTGPRILLGESFQAKLQEGDRQSLVSKWRTESQVQEGQGEFASWDSESRAPHQERPLPQIFSIYTWEQNAPEPGKEPPERSSGTILSAHTEQGIGSVLISQREKPHNVRILGRACMLRISPQEGEKKISTSNAALVTPDKALKSKT